MRCDTRTPTFYLSVAALCTQFPNAEIHSSVAVTRKFYERKLIGSGLQCTK